MKKILTGLVAIACTINATAQLADGSIAPNFTFKDLNGTTQDLYTYLNQGKYVVIDVSATWCGPCWYAHNTLKVLEDQYTKHDEAGDKTSKVLFIEGDVNTTLADLQGTGSNTQGNWVNGTLYPIMNPTATPQAGETSYASFDNGFNIGFFPTFFVICPDKKVWQDTLNNTNAPWASVKTLEWIASNKCGLKPSGLDDVTDAKPVSIYPNPANTSMGIYFSLKSAGKVMLEVYNTLGVIVANKNLGLLNAGDQSIQYNTTTLPSGNYILKLTTDNGRTFNSTINVLH